MSLFHPTVLKNRITDLTPNDLHTMQVKAVLLDVDNTLTRHHSQELCAEVEAWLSAVQESGIGCMLVSNSKQPRIDPFAKRIGLPYIHTAMKPLPFGFRRAVKALGVSKKACLVIGDQTFTDVLGARLCGIRVAQLLPIEEETGRSFRVRRRLEKGILARFRKKTEKKGSQ